MVQQNGFSSKEMAIAYANRGWSVFPCHTAAGGRCSCGDADCGSPGKHPRTQRGFLDASDDPATVEKYFRGDRAGSNIALATGTASGVWVLDEDGPDGMRVVEELEQRHGQLPVTVTALTGRLDGGRHRYFAYPNSVEIKSRNKVELPGFGKVNVDLRGSGGYAILPPSVHASGKAYRWEHSPDSTPIATAPDWLLNLLNSQSSPLEFTVAEAVEDLSTAAGVAEGQRHRTALRLIGRALGRGLDLVEVARQAIAWNARCIPPLPDNAVLKIVNDLSRKDRAKAQATPEPEPEVEDIALPKAVAWPVLDQMAMHGIAGEIVRVIEPQSEADPVAILVQLLASFGNLIGRKPHYLVEGNTHHSNIFTVLVGSTARGRKGTSEGRVRQIFKLVEDRWLLDSNKTGLASGEGLIWSVRDPIYKLDHQKEKGRIVGSEMVLADPGVSDKRLLVVEPEFAAVLRVCKRETNTLSPTIRSAWDTGILRTMAKNSPATATDAHISIVGHITLEELRRGLAEVDGFNGFANRFLWLCVKRSKLLPDGGRDLDLTPYTDRFKRIVALSKDLDRMRRDDAATELWQSVYADLANDDSKGLLGAVTSRAEAQVLRLSMIYALLDASDQIKVDHLKAALALWRYCQQSARLIFGDTPADTLDDKVLTVIRHVPGISRKGIHKATGNHIAGPVLAQILARLRDSKLARVEIIETGGRPAESWHACEQSELSEQRSSRDSGLSSLCSHSSQEVSDQAVDSSLCSHSSQAEPESEWEVFTI